MEIDVIIQGVCIEKTKDKLTLMHARTHTGDKGRETSAFSYNDTFCLSFLSRRTG